MLIQSYNANLEKGGISFENPPYFALVQGHHDVAYRDGPVEHRNDGVHHR